MPAAGGGRNGEMLVKGYKPSVIRGINSEDLVHSMVTIVDNTMFYLKFAEKSTS